MKEEGVTDALLREFLLGKVNDEERERIENLFLTDSGMRERVLSLEEDLMEEYLEDSLSEEDKKIFISRYAQTEEQRRKLRITKSIKNWAVKEAMAAGAAAGSVSVWSRLRTRLRLKPIFVVPITVTIVIAIVLAIVWLNSRMEQQKHLALEQELAQLNSPASLREVPPQMTSLELRPGTVRGVESEREVKPRDDIRIVELHLLWSRKERYASYRVEVGKVGDDESFTIPNIQPQPDGGNVIRVRLLARMLSRGHYRIQLSGIADDGSADSVEEYQFAVSE